VSAGSREFVEQYFFRSEFQDMSKTIQIALSIDLSSDNNVISCANAGATYPRWGGRSAGQMQLAPMRGWLSRFRTTMIATLPGYEYDRYVGSAKEVATMVYRFETDPVAITGIAGMCYHTTNSYRMSWETMLDNANNMNWNNLLPQLTFVYTSFYQLTHDETIDFKKTEPKAPTRDFYDANNGIAFGFLTLSGDMSRITIRKMLILPGTRKITVHLLSSCLWPVAPSVLIPLAT
jgi:hypothetical protein